MDVSSGILGVVELWSDGFDIPVLQHSSTPLPRIYYFSIQYVFTRNEPNDLILRGVSNDAQRIKTFLNRFDGFFIQAAQKNNSPVGVSQMFAGAVVDRTLAFLRDAILIAAGEPVNRLIPFVDAKLRLYQPLLGFIFHDFRDRFAIDDGAEFHREVHRVSVVDGHAPTHHFARTTGLMFGGMTFFHVAGFIHCRQEKKVDVRVSFPGNVPGVGVQNSIFKWLWINLAIIPRGGLCRSVQPLQVILVDGVLDHLKKVAIDGSRTPRAHAVVPHQHVESRQQRRGLGPKVGEDDAAEFLNLVSRVAKPLPKRAISRLTGHFQNLTFDIVQPAVITTAQAAILKMTELK